MKSRILSLILTLMLVLPTFGVRPLVWVLDAGHGGKDVGCEGLHSQEKDINLQVTQEVAKLLKKNKPGIKIILTRDKDEFISLEERCNIANNANADLFLSIHVNYAPNNKILTGCETYYATMRESDDAVLQSARSRNMDKSELLAWLMQHNYYNAGRVTNRGIKQEQLYVVMHTMMPAALTEIGFMSNREEENYMTSKRGRKEIAECIYKGLMEYYTTTQAKTEKETLQTLRRTNGRVSGLKDIKKPKQPQEEDEIQIEEPVPEPQPELAAEPQAQEPTEVVPAPADTTTAVVPAPAPEPEKKSTKKRKNENANSPAVPVFSIQLVAVSSELKADDPALKGLSPVTFVKAGTMFKALYGGTTDYKKAKKTLAEIRDKFPDAFIVAYLGDQPITTADALQMISK